MERKDGRHSTEALDPTTTPEEEILSTGRWWTLRLLTILFGAALGTTMLIAIAVRVGFAQKLRAAGARCL